MRVPKKEATFKHDRRMGHGVYTTIPLNLVDAGKVMLELWGDITTVEGLRDSRKSGHQFIGRRLSGLALITDSACLAGKINKAAGTGRKKKSEAT